MNSQFIAGQPPPNYLQPSQGNPMMQPMVNNGTNHMPPPHMMPPLPSAFDQPNISQKMHSMSLGGPGPQQQTNGQFTQPPVGQYQKPPVANFPPQGKPPMDPMLNSPPGNNTLPQQGLPPSRFGMDPNAFNQQMPPGMNQPPSNMNMRPPSNLSAQSMPPSTGSFPDKPGFAMNQAQNTLPPMSAPNALPPMSASNAMPPMSAPSSMPPMLAPSGMPPMSPPSGMPHMSAPSGMPPISASSGMPPMSAPSGMPHMPPQSGMTSMGAPSGMPPMSAPSGMPPMSSASGMPPMSAPMGMPPTSQGQISSQKIQNIPPFSNPMQQNQFPGQNIPPAGQPGQMPQGFANQPNFQNQQKPGLPPMPGQGLPSGPAMQGFHQGAPGQGMPPGPQMGSAPRPGMPPNQDYQNIQKYPMQSPPGYPNQAGYPPAQQMGYANQQPGYPNQQPPFPGQQPSYPGQHPEYPEQQQTKKLNPDHMPSPIQVMMDDQNANGGEFVTHEKGRVPPLVTTDFVVNDQGNASPRFIRSSMYNVPATPDMIKQTAVPFCVLLSPLAELVGNERPPPLLDFSILTGVPGSGPVRCSRCKAYMCPAMKFVDAGRHFQCAFCKATTEVPMEYTQYLNNGQHYGQNSPEMSLGCYEIVATKEYCRNNELPSPPAIIFVIDVSYNAIKSGMVELLIGSLRSMLESLPIPPRIGIITYSSKIHFYNINEILGQPQMMVVGDIQDVFVPLAKGLLAQPSQISHLLDALAHHIPAMFAETKETETMLLPAVRAGLEALKAADCCGKLLVFHSALPTLQAPGQLLNRDDRKLLGTDKEKNILTPQTKAYNELAQECVGSGCGVELFLFNNSYVDVATIGQLARLTGGGVNKYTYFQASVDGHRFIYDLNHVLARPTAYDAVMRVRTSTGVRATDFYGHFFMSNTTDVELATLDCDKAIAVEIKHDDKLTGEDGVYIQVALLYTHATGQRRLRICNLSLGIATQMADLYRTCDLDTVINFLAKQAVWRLNEHAPKSIKEGIITRCATSLACYRKHCASPSSVGQLVLPESMKLLPLFINCLLRSDALSGGSDMSCDDRSWAMQAALCADVNTSLVMFYPSLYHINPLANGLPAELLRCTIDKLKENSIFLLENSIHMMLWIGLQTPQELIRELFGVNSVAEVNTEELELPVLTTPFNENVRDLIESLRQKRKRCMRLTMIRQHDKLEMVFRHFLVEDDGRNGASSYMDFLCHLHKEIRGLL